MIDPSYKRRSLRLQKYDYSNPGAYFLTICTQNKKCIFGEVTGNQVLLNTLGKIAGEVWREIPIHFPMVDLDVSVIMPNHIHGIFVLRSCRGEACLALTETMKQRTSLGLIVGSFKSAVTKRINENNTMPVVSAWQRNYYERVIRDEGDLNKIREYIVNNPLQWAMDEENPNRHKGEACLAPTKILNQKSRNGK